MSHRRRFPWLVLVLAAGCASDASRLSSVLEELQNLPDASESMEDAYRTLHELGLGPNDPVIRIGGPGPSAGHVVAMWRDRLAAAIDEGSSLPPEGGFMAVYDDAGYLGDFYVVCLRGRRALGQLRQQESRAPIEVGNRVRGAPW